MSASEEAWKAGMQRFGDALVALDGAGGCIVRVDDLTHQNRRMHLHSLDEIAGAYQMQQGMASTDPIAADIARALKFAGQQIKSQEGKR